MIVVKIAMPILILLCKRWLVISKYYFDRLKSMFPPELISIALTALLSLSLASLIIIFDEFFIFRSIANRVAQTLRIVL